MTDDVVISVIVVTYNQEHTIARALDSILSQNIDARFEIIIGDDESSDSTAEVCREYARNYPDIIRYYRRERNLGVVRNYYQCLSDCCGEYIADCAGDDFWVDNEKLAKQLAVMQADSDVALVHTDWRNCNIDGSNVRPVRRFAVDDRNLRKDFAKGELTAGVLARSNWGLIHLCTALYRRNILEAQLKRFPDLFMSDEYKCEDIQIVTALAASGKIVYLPFVSLHYSVAANSVSHQSDFKKRFEQLKSNLVLTDRLSRTYGVGCSELAEYYVNTMHYLAAQVFHSGDKSLRSAYYDLKHSNQCYRRVSFKTRVMQVLFSNVELWRVFRWLLGKRKSL